jgi:hypothetical protein
LRDPHVGSPAVVTATCSGLPGVQKAGPPESPMQLPPSPVAFVLPCSLRKYGVRELNGEVVTYRLPKSSPVTRGLLMLRSMLLIP